MPWDFKKYLGIPFKTGGRDYAGADCFGLVRIVYSDLGLSIPDYQTPNSADESIKIISAVIDSKENNELKQIFSFWKWIRIDRPRPLAIVTFWIRNPNFSSHLGIMIDNDKFLHSRRMTNSCIERLSEAFWRKRVTGFFWNTDLKIQDNNNMRV